MILHSLSGSSWLAALSLDVGAIGSCLFFLLAFKGACSEVLKSTDLSHRRLCHLPPALCGKLGCFQSVYYTSKLFNFLRERKRGKISVI